MGARIVSDNRAQVRASIVKKADAAMGDAARQVEAQAKLKAPEFLRSEIRTVRVQMLHWRISVHDPRARPIELGTTRTRARPFLLPAFMAVSKFLKAALKRIGV